jgi:replication factor C subunit 3/5
MLLIDKHAPKHIDDVFFHEDIVEQLKILSKKEDLPHMLFYGPSDSGKKTLVNQFLEMIFDKTVNDLQTPAFTITTTGSNSKQTVFLKKSNYHIVLEPNNNNFDKHIIHDIIKDYAQTKPLPFFSVKKNFKIVVINNADKLSLSAQTSLRRTMELCSSTCKFILWCSKISSIIDPIKSRCNPIRISAPSDGDLLVKLIEIASLENMKLTLKEYDEIVKKANGRIKTALWMLQFKKLQITDTQTSYERTIKNIVKLLCTPNIKNIITIRKLIYDIFITNINRSQILISILEELYMCEFDDTKLKMIIDIGAEYEHRLLFNRKPITHLEAFIIDVFEVINTDELARTYIIKKKDTAQH